MARQILAKADALWETLPSSLRCDYDVWDVKPIYEGSWTLFLVQVDYLYSAFLLHRHFLKQRQAGADALLSTARKLLLASLTITSERRQIAEYNRDVSWTVRMARS